MISNPERLQSRTEIKTDQDLKMSGFVIRSVSVVYLLVILTGPSSASHGWEPPVPVIPTYPSDPQDPYYQGKIVN